ncbi:protein argonaute-2-like [Anopheles marshallii]|uniref:protein argonaute-2-like n=1 Tax=Anopheles marshallii TaxID=1521116 RepID=UPI00237C14D2|nr:protein argonaute-2-like [Anopheles marshallii]
MGKKKQQKIALDTIGHGTSSQVSAALNQQQQQQSPLVQDAQHQQARGSQQPSGPQQRSQGSQQPSGPQQRSQGSQQPSGPQQRSQGSQQPRGPQQRSQGSQLQKEPQQQHPQAWQQQKGSQQHPQAWQQQHSQAWQQQKGPQQHSQAWQQQQGPQQHPQAWQQQQGPQQHPQAWQQQKGSQQHPQAWQQQQGPPKQSKQYKQQKENHPQSLRAQEKDGPHEKKHPEHTTPTAPIQTPFRKPDEQRPSGGGAPHHDGSVSSSESGSPGDGTRGHTEENIEQMRNTQDKRGRTNQRPVLVRSGAQGTSGMKVTVEANFFRLLLGKLKDVAYHYDVAIEPDRPKKFLRAVFDQFCRENHPGAVVAYDGRKSAYTTRKLTDKQAQLMYQPDDGGIAKEYIVQMKEVAQLDLTVLKTYMHSNDATFVKPMSAIQCLDVVLRCACETNPNLVRFKRCVYMVPTESIRIGKVYELWYGLFQSAVLGSRPYLNLDVSHKAFPCAAELLDVIRYFNGDNLKLQSFLKGMDVIYRRPTGIASRMRCNGLLKPANEQFFNLDDGTRLTVADYFANRLNYPLTHPDLPVLHVGSTVRSVYVPAELCAIPGGQTLTKNPEACTREIIRYAATNTQKRKDKIKELTSMMRYNACPTLLDFGIAVGNEFEKVPARIIDAPPIEYATNKTITPMSGVWKSEKFLQPGTERAGSREPIRWRILNLERNIREATVENFGKNLQQQARKCNVQLEEFDMGRTYVSVRDLFNVLRDIGKLLEGIKKDNPTITIVILPSRGDAYAKVKQKAELASERIGLLTQCIKSGTVADKGNDMSTLKNIMLKINAKTNGANHCVSQTAVPPLGCGKVMYMGADVTHPLSDDAPSVVGVTAVHDLIGFRYNCGVRLQGARDEMIRDLENIAYQQLRLYRQHNGDLPERIMYYRDGVSDGQFSEILTVELRALHAAIARVKPGYKPAVTFIVVQKRHHTRFFPHGDGQNGQTTVTSVGKNRNVLPGTVVDSEITLPTRYEFYLVSHAAVLGVAKPTKYVVLHDESNCAPDELQTLTYHLCHLFARCNRTVSYPAPTYYAHLAAARGRVYIKDRRINMNDLEKASRDIEIIATVAENNPMFFV